MIPDKITGSGPNSSSETPPALQIITDEEQQTLWVPEPSLFYSDAQRYYFTFISKDKSLAALIPIISIRVMALLPPFSPLPI